MSDASKSKEDGKQWMVENRAHFDAAEED